MQSSFDRRRTELAITDAGRELVARAPETVSARLIASLAAMQPEERQSLADLMERWLDLARIDRATAPMFLEDEPPQ
jgi:DNA-binding MarR family transcriptional regulator